MLEGQVGLCQHVVSKTLIKLPCWLGLGPSRLHFSRCLLRSSHGQIASSTRKQLSIPALMQGQPYPLLVMSNNNLFGSINAGNQSQNPFGGQNNSNSLFGQKPASSNAESAPAKQTSLFGSSTGTTASPFGGAANSSATSGFGFGMKPEENAQSTPGGGLFDRMSTPNKAPSTDQQGQNQTGNSSQALATPIKPIFSTNNPSTTPAGPPPANASNGLFGASGTNATSLFGSLKKPAESQSQNQSEGQSGAQPPASSAPSMFGPTPSSYGKPPYSAPISLFAKPGQPASANQPSNNNSGTAAPNTSAPEATTAAESSSKVAFSFPSSSNPGTAKSSSFQPSPAASGAPPTPSLFGKPAQENGSSAPKSQPSSIFQPSPATSGAPATPSLFGKPAQEIGNSMPKSQPPSLFGQQTNNAQSQPQQGNLFGATPKDSSKPASLFSKPDQTSNNDAPVTSVEGTSKPTETSNATTAPSLTISAPQTSNQGQKKGETTSSTGGASLGPINSTAAGGASALGNSTSGPAPTAQSRLKNKSMDEIITRWSSDLSKYQKDFQAQAEKVAQWDRQLVENSNAISKLYSKTFQAERDTAEVQKQLSAVEGHQDELAQWLDRYEHEVDEMMSRQVGQGDGMQGPDQERERT